MLAIGRKHRQFGRLEPVIIAFRIRDALVQIGRKLAGCKNFTVFLGKTGQFGWVKISRDNITEALAKRQRPDGSWINESDRWMEGDPNLVTGYALLALSYCGGPQ